MINKALAKKVIDTALLTGADFVELYLEKTYSKNINHDNGHIENIGTFSSIGIGIRLLKENRSVYGYTNDLKEKSLLELAKNLSGAFNDKQIVQCKEFIDKKAPNLSPIKDSFFITSAESKIAILDKLAKTMKEYSPLIIRSIAAINGQQKEVEIYNSNGLHIKDKKERINLIAEAIAAEGDKHEIGYNSIGTVGGMEQFDKVNFDELAKTVAKNAVSMLSAKECPSGKMPVIVGNGFGGVLFHEACGHSLEASSVSKGLSVFSNRLGEQIASPIVNAYDDGTIPNQWGSENIDDEGNSTNKTCLIKDGVLVNYLIDNFNGRRMNKTGNGVCRRQNYKYEPTSRMSNTYIANGKSTLDEIIKATKLGLYAKQLGGGSVNPATGEFEFACLLAYIVRDGKIAEQVKGATLIGTGEEILKNIDMVGNDLDFDCGYCGAASGNVPVTTGQPTIRIKEILVGGNGGKIE